MEAEWRVAVGLHDASRASRAVLRHQVADGIRARLGGLATLSPNASELFVYTASEAAATEAAQAARELIAQHGLQAEVSVAWWDPLGNEWDEDTMAAPSTWELAHAEHRRRVADDTERSEVTGVAQWTVRVMLPSRHDAVELAPWFSCQGVQVIRRGKSVLLGASNEDAAHELARQAMEQAPGGRVRIERTLMWAPPPDYGPVIFS